MYYRTDTKEVLASHSEVRSSFFNGNVIVMFSDILTDEDLASRGVFPMTYNIPETTAGKVASPLSVELVDGVWTQTWEIRDTTPDEAAEFEASKAAAIGQCYSDVDGVTRDAVGNRTEEYRVAEESARQFRSGGYVGDADITVSSYATYNATGTAQSDQWAADQIIARADAFRNAQGQMRAKRFEYQDKMRRATDVDDLSQIVSEWQLYMMQIRKVLGL